MDELTQNKLELYHQIARHLWAIVVVIAEIHLGVHPNWRKRGMEN